MWIHRRRTHATGELKHRQRLFNRQITASLNYEANTPIPFQYFTFPLICKLLISDLPMNFYCLRSFEQGGLFGKRFVYSGFLFYASFSSCTSSRNEICDFIENEIEKERWALKGQRFKKNQSCNINFHPRTHTSHHSCLVFSIRRVRSSRRQSSS